MATMTADLTRSSSFLWVTTAGGSGRRAERHSSAGSRGFINGLNDLYILETFLARSMRLLAPHQAEGHVIHLERELISVVNTRLKVGAVSFEQPVVVKFEAAVAE
jgi:hypothetical protein